jgi:hypothetical protein
MRFALVALAWLILVGGLSFYIHERDSRPAVEISKPAVREAARGNYTLEVTPTFSTAADPFALQGEVTAASTLQVSQGDKIIYRTEESLEAGMTVRVHPVAGLTAGRNELYLQASPPLSDIPRDNAVRVRVLLDNRVLVDETLWAESGAKVSGTIAFSLTKPEDVDHDHEH